VELPIAGIHNVSNALAALSFAVFLGFPFFRAANALSGFEPYAGRQSVRAEFSGVTVIDDSYNANAGSMKASLSALKLRKGRKIAVLGSIMELGAFTESVHKEIGAFAAEAADALFFFGPSARLSRGARRTPELGRYSFLRTTWKRSSPLWPVSFKKATALLLKLQTE
jgi:UDP-N-acetylmuramyl pentapeptide synthase